MLELPKTKIKPDNLDPRTLLIYGPPKIGKTTILSGLEDNLIIDIEDGSEYVEALKIKAKDLGELTEIGTEIITQERPYEYVTLDTISRLEDWALDNADRKYRNTPQGRSFQGTTIMELDYGLGYGLLREEFKKWMNKVKKLSKTTIYVAHVKDKIIGKDKGEEVAAKDINLTGQLKAIVTSDVDAVGYMYIDPEDPTQRKITFITSDDTTCGNRCAHLEGKEFVISKKLEDGTVKTYWDKIFQGSPVTA